MVRVIEFITSMGEGGAQSLVKDYALHLNKKQFDVRIFCLFPMVSMALKLELEKSQVELKSAYPEYSIIWRLVNKIAGKYIVGYKLKKELIKFQPEVIHAHLGVLHYLLAVKRLLPKVFYTCHSVPLRTFKSTKSKEFLAARQLIASRKLQLIALHNQMREELNRLFDINNTIVLYNGIDINRVNDVKEDKTEIRRTLGIDNNAFVLGHVGRFIPEKNHEFIINIFNKIHECVENSKLILIGTGPLQNTIKKQVASLGLEKYVEILNHRDDVNRLLKAMDVFLFPSFKEGFPVSLIEAQAAGLHCVVSDNITDEAFISSQLVSLSLDSSVEEWAKTALSINSESSRCECIHPYTILTVIQRLEKLYKQ